MKASLDLGFCYRFGTYFPDLNPRDARTRQLRTLAVPGGVYGPSKLHDFSKGKDIHNGKDHF